MAIVQVESASNFEMEIPGQMIPKAFNIKDLYILYFRSRDNPRPSEKYFNIPNVGDFRDVITRCKEYCTNMGYRFVKVERFLSDMAEDEKKARTQG